MATANPDLRCSRFPDTASSSVLWAMAMGFFPDGKGLPDGANPSSIVAADFNGGWQAFDWRSRVTPLGSSPGNLVSLLLVMATARFGRPLSLARDTCSYSSLWETFNGDGSRIWQWPMAAVTP